VRLTRSRMAERSRQTERKGEEEEEATTFFLLCGRDPARHDRKCLVYAISRIVAEVMMTRCVVP
jgi:hypothetical protein